MGTDGQIITYFRDNHITVRRPDRLYANVDGEHQERPWAWQAAAVAHDEPQTTTVVTTAPPPAAGTFVGSLPGGCTTVTSGGGTLYNCNNVLYRPYYQGTAVVYQVVPG